MTASRSSSFSAVRLKCVRSSASSASAQLPPPFEQQRRKPVEPGQMLRQKRTVLLREPFERDFGFPAPAGCQLNRSKTLSIFAAYGRLELGSVGPQQTAEPTDGDPEIVERLAVETIVESALRRSGCRQALESQAARGFLVAPEEEIVWQAASSLGVRMPGKVQRRFRGRVRDRNDRCRISSFASDVVTPESTRSSTAQPIASTVRPPRPVRAIRRHLSPRSSVG